MSNHGLNRCFATLKQLVESVNVILVPHVEPVLTVGSNVKRGRGILIRACQFDNLVFALPWRCVTRGSGFLLYFVTVVDRFYRPIFLEVEQ